MRRSCGFTLIEMVIVTIVLLLMAAMVVPRMVAITRSREVHRVEAALQRAPMEARNESVRSHLPVQMKVENGAIVLYRVQGQNDTQEFKRVPLVDEIQVESARQEGNAIDLASWQWTVYPDGTSDRAGLQFNEGLTRKSLVMSDHGDAVWIQGDLPDMTEERWPAGEIEQRG